MPRENKTSLLTFIIFSFLTTKKRLGSFTVCTCDKGAGRIQLFTDCFACKQMNSETILIKKPFSSIYFEPHILFVLQLLVEIG